MFHFTACLTGKDVQNFVPLFFFSIFKPTKQKRMNILRNIPFSSTLIFSTIHNLFFKGLSFIPFPFERIRSP